MSEYFIRLSDRGKYGDITLKLKEILHECKNDKEKTVYFEKGEYHFYPDFADREVIYCSNTDSHRFPEKSIAINIDRQKKLTVDGQGSKFVMHGKMISVKVSYSEKIRLKNFTWDFPNAANFEMGVTDAGVFYTDYSIPSSQVWEIKGKHLVRYDKSPFDGKKYWENTDQKKTFCILGHDTVNKNVSRYDLLKGPLAFVLKLKKLSDSTLRVFYCNPKRILHRKGMIFELCTSYNRDCVGALFLESKNVTAEKINVRYMNGFGWLTQMCENISFLSCNFTPEENAERHCVSFADLIHVSGAKGKVHIENCKFSNAHDDPINIHGTFTRVNKRIDEHTLFLQYVHNQQNGFVQYHAGDKVAFCLRETLEEYPGIFTVKSVINPLENGNGLKEMQVTFEEKIPDEIAVPEKYAVENITYTPEVYIGGCHFTLIPTRGILCTTRRKTVIENNVFDGMTMSSIYLSNDCNDWYESGAIHDMTVRNNKFNVKKGPNPRTVNHAVFIEPIVANKNKMAKCVHRNITIENNEFNMECSNVVNASCTENLVIRNNKINTVNYKGEFKPFVFNGCENVICENNKE